MRSSIQARLSTVAGFEACGQSSKPQKSFAYACQKTLEAFCLPSLFAISPGERSHSYDILLRTREKKRWGEKSLKAPSLNRDAGQAASTKHIPMFSESRNCPEGKTRSKHIFVSDVDHLKHQIFFSFKI